MGTDVSVAGGDWSCAAAGDVRTCLHRPVILAPGASLSLPLDVRLPRDSRPDSVFTNCAALAYPEVGDSSFEPVRFVQTWLTAAGLDVGPIDNATGSKTNAGIKAFRRDVGLPDSSEIDDALIEALRARFPADSNPENDRACVEVQVAQLTATPTEIVCEGGRVGRGECNCPEGTEQQQTGDNAFRCVAPTSTPTPIACDGGRIQRGKCVCGEGAELKQIGDNAFECVASEEGPGRVTCEGGSVEDGKCVCFDGAELEQTGDTSFQCVKPETPRPVEIICEGGSEQDGKCVCSEGAELKQMGDASFLCVEAELKPVEISCEGGSVQDGKCDCPEGTELQQTGDASFECKGG